MSKPNYVVFDHSSGLDAIQSAIDYNESILEEFTFDSFLRYHYDKLPPSALTRGGFLCRKTTVTFEEWKANRSVDHQFSKLQYNFLRRQFKDRLVELKNLEEVYTSNGGIKSIMVDTSLLARHKNPLAE